MAQRHELINQRHTQHLQLPQVHFAGQRTQGVIQIIQPDDTADLALAQGLVSDQNMPGTVVVQLGDGLGQGGAIKHQQAALPAGQARQVERQWAETLDRKSVV